jgi:hypothetical protein
MVEREPILCGLLNGDVDTFVVLNFRNKSCVFCALCDLLFIHVLVYCFLVFMI